MDLVQIANVRKVRCNSLVLCTSVFQTLHPKITQTYLVSICILTHHHHHDL